MESRLRRLAGKDQLIVEGTLDGYLKGHVNRLTAGWVAALLEKAGIVTIDGSRPARVQAATGSASRSRAGR